jgi:drug/metabolite transporter (DMT)-like permease
LTAVAPHAYSKAALTPRRAFAVLHVTVFIWGFTAILGKLISLSAMTLVFYRQALAATVLLFWVFGVRRAKALPFGDIVKLAGIGVLVGAHWVFFYSAIKTTGISFAVVCLSAASLGVACFEPLVFRKPVEWVEVAFGLVVIAAVMLLVGATGTANSLGIVYGVTAALLSGLFSTLNGKLMQRLDSARVSAYELSAGALWVGFALLVWPQQFVAPLEVSANDWFWLLILSVVCTVLPWLWQLDVIRTLSPFSLTLAVNLEPVYSIALAYWMFPAEERLGLRFYFGAALLVALVFAHGIFKSLTQKQALAS